MKSSKQILIFSLVTVGFWVLTPALSALMGVLPSESLWLSQILFYLTRLASAIPPFFMLGVAVGALRVRGMGYAMALLGIYAGLDLFLQVPLTLLTYDSVASSAPFSLILFAELLAEALSATVFLLLLVLGYSAFMQGRKQGNGAALFSLGDASGRILGLCALIVTLYNLVYEIVEIVRYAKDKLYILSGEDILDIGISLLFLLFLGFFLFFVARLSERLLPTLPPDDSDEEALSE